MVLVVDDEDRENEGDLQMAADCVTGEALNFMLRWARGLECMPCAGSWLDRLDIEPMVPAAAPVCDTAFTVSIDHRNAGSGIGAADRALTVRRVLDPSSRPDDFVRPGTCSRCAPARAACWIGAATPRPRSTSRDSPDCRRWRSSARCCTTTARPRASRISSCSRRSTRIAMISVCAGRDHRLEIDDIESSPRRCSCSRLARRLVAR
jgi:hypothetical protein